ncbi:hypothetical protein HK104_006049 [Borealophlyctis nickersoniae]|nr:hypothetical protein HK104_006049 [Borealophlyctis nickersoniae]
MIQLGSTGFPSATLNGLRIIFVALASTAFFAVLLYASKGWYIVRLQFAPVEQRTMLTTAVFSGMAEVFFFVVQGASLIAQAIFYVATYAYIIINLRIHINILAAYINKLKLSGRSEVTAPPTRGGEIPVYPLDGDWDIVTVYKNKLWMLRITMRIVLSLILVTLFVRIVDYLEVAAPIYLAAARHVVDLGSFIALG